MNFLYPNYLIDQSPDALIIMKKKYDVITVGGATEDITFYTKEGVLIDNKNDILRQKLFAFEYGAKIRIDKSYSTFGGGAANAAVGLATLGFKVGTIVAVGDDDRGKSIIKNFKSRKVDTSLIHKIKGAETGFSFLMVGPNSEHVVFSNRAANTKLEVAEKDIKNLEKSKWVYITSLSGRWRSVLKNVFSAKGVKIAWNPGHIQLNAGAKEIGKYLLKTEILTLNKDEAIELVSSDPLHRAKGDDFLNDVKNLLTIIKDWGPRIVIVTNGKFGADAYDGEKFYHVNILKERRRLDTTGVGDAFGSTFVAGIELFKGDILKAMKGSVKNTASVIGMQGAQNGLLTRTQIIK